MKHIMFTESEWNRPHPLAVIKGALWTKSIAQVSISFIHLHIPTIVKPCLSGPTNSFYLHLQLKSFPVSRLSFAWTPGAAAQVASSFYSMPPPFLFLYYLPSYPAHVSSFFTLYVVKWLLSDTFTQDPKTINHHESELGERASSFVELVKS